MTRATHREREEFVSVIQQHAGGEVARRLGFAQRMMRYGATYGRIQGRACNGHQTWNGDWDEAAAKRDEAKEAKLEAAIAKLAAEFGCVPVFGGDPRGATVKLTMPDGFTNDWGREGVCVPTS